MLAGKVRLLSPQDKGYILHNKKVTFPAIARLFSSKHVWRNLLKMGLIDNPNKTRFHTLASMDPKRHDAV